jgi:ABC-type spermidine/putrescine transport system permease subunit II
VAVHPDPLSSIVARLSEAWEGLPDKPEETPESTARALWFLAAGAPRSVARVPGDLPDLTSECAERLEALVAARLSGVPLAYLTGRQSFMGLELLAEPHAMVPRRETELLGAKALECLRALLANQDHARVLDICTGSGNLAVALAVHEPRCTVFGSDLMPEAVSLARRNAELHRLGDRVRFFVGDLFEAFETPALLGMPSGIWVFTSRIWRVLSSFPVDYGQAGAYSLSLLLLTTAGIYMQSRFSKRSKQFQTVTGKGFRPRPMPLGKLRTPITVAVLAYFFVAIIMPALVLVYMSTQPSYTVPSWQTLSNVSWENYEYIFNHSQTMRSFRNSFILGIGTATAVMFFTAIASWLVIRGRVPGRWLVDNLAFLPLVIPGLVMGVALIFVYLRFPIAIYGTLWILFISYCTRYMPYGMRYASASTYQIGGELEESAQVSGASWWQTFRRINLPLLMPGLIAGWIYILMSSVRELSSSILLYSPGNEVLAIMIWEQYENGQFTELAALGVLMIALLVVLVLVALRFGAKIGVQSD